MRRALIIITAALFTCLTSHAQTYLGGRAGYNMSTISLPDRSNKLLNDVTFMDYGISLKHYDNKYIGFYSQLNLIQKGYRREFEESELNPDYKRINTYLELPILIQGRLAGGKAFIHAHTGCYGALLLKSVHGYMSTANGFDLTDYTINVLYDNRFDYGLISGGGFGFEFSWGTLQLEVNYYYGFADLYSYKASENPTTSRGFTYSANLTYFVNLSQIFEGRRQKREFINRINEVSPEG